MKRWIMVGSVRVGRDHLAAGDRAQGCAGWPLIAVLDEPDRAVAQQDVDAAGVVAVGGDSGVDRAARCLVGRSRCRKGSGRPGGCTLVLGVSAVVTPMSKMLPLAQFWWLELAVREHAGARAPGSSPASCVRVGEAGRRQAAVRRAILELGVVDLASR